MGPLIPTFSGISTTIVSEQENGQRFPYVHGFFLLWDKPNLCLPCKLQHLIAALKLLTSPSAPDFDPADEPPHTTTLHLIFRSPLNRLKPATNPDHTKTQTAYAPLSCIS